MQSECPKKPIRKESPLPYESNFEKFDDDPLYLSDHNGNSSFSSIGSFRFSEEELLTDDELDNMTMKNLMLQGEHSRNRRSKNPRKAKKENLESQSAESDLQSSLQAAIEEIATLKKKIQVHETPTSAEGDSKRRERRTLGAKHTKPGEPPKRRKKTISSKKTSSAKPEAATSEQKCKVTVKKQQKCDSNLTKREKPKNAAPRLDKMTPKEEMEKHKIEQCLLWYRRLGQPNKALMKQKVAKLGASVGITPEDVDSLPWVAGGSMLNTVKMNDLYLKKKW